MKPKKCTVSSVENEIADIETVIKESSDFVSLCYGVNRANTMSEARVRLWAKMAGISLATAPKLGCLTTTTKGLSENAK